MRTRWMCLLAFIVVTATPSCIKKPQPTRKISPPAAVTIAPDAEVSQTPPVVEEPETVSEPEVETAPPVVRRPARRAPRIAMAPKQPEPAPVFIISEPSNTTASESQIVEPESLGGATLETETIIPVQSKMSFDALIGNSVDLQSSGVYEAQVGVGFEFPLIEGARMGFAQSFRKLFSPGANLAGEKDILAEDTRIYVEHEIMNNPPIAAVKLNVGATLPVSRRSNRSGNITRANIGVTATGNWFGGDLKITASPDLQYYFNDSRVNLSGSPVSQLAVAQGVSVDWAVAPALHWVTWVRAHFRVYEPANAALARLPGTSGTYGLGSYLEYDFGGVMLRGGLMRASSMFENIRTTDIYYDASPTTRFFVALSAAL